VAVAAGSFLSGNSSLSSQLQSMPTNDHVSQWLADEEVLVSRRPALSFVLVTICSVVFIMSCAKQWEQIRVHRHNTWMQAQNAKRKNRPMSMESWLAKTTGTSAADEEMENLVGSKDDVPSVKYGMLEDHAVSGSCLRAYRPFVLGLLTLTGTLLLHVAFAETCRSSLFNAHVGAASWFHHIAMYWGFDDQTMLEQVQGETLATVANMMSHINATYAVAAGSLLPFARLDAGVARMIPWDGDGDVFILQGDLKRLAKANFSGVVDFSMYEISVEGSQLRFDRSDAYTSARLTHRNLGRHVDFIQLMNLSERVDACTRSHIRFDSGHSSKLEHCERKAVFSLDACKLACSSSSCMYWEWDAEELSCRSCRKGAWDTRFPGSESQLVGPKDCTDEFAALVPEFSTAWSRGQAHCSQCRHAPGDEEYGQYRVPQTQVLPTLPCPAPYLLPTTKRKIALQCPQQMRETLTYAFGGHYQQPPPGRFLCGVHKRTFGLLPFLLLSAFLVVLLDIKIEHLCAYASHYYSSGKQQPPRRRTVKGMPDFDDDDL